VFTRHLVSLVCAVSAALASGCARPTTTAAPEPGLGQALQHLVDGLVQSNATVRGAAMHVDSPRLGLLWEGAAGLADPSTGEAMTPDHPVRIASNTKTFVAVAILRLVEQGRIGIDDPIADHLPEAHTALLVSGGYAPDRITVRHLLTHTSGLYDHSDSERYAERIMADPSHRWTPTEQLTAAIEWGKPWGMPGEVYHYCDTGYVLLGQILERTTGASLAKAARQLVGFDALDLASTWWETLEPRPAGLRGRAHQFLGDTDTHDFDPSLDLYGGGGLVCTVGDLARFHRAALTGELYEDPATLATMLSTIEGVGAAADASERSLAPGAYRMGLWVVDVDGREVYWHSGFWGTVATYTPSLDLTVTATLNQHDSRVLIDQLVRQVVRLAAEASARSERSTS